MKLSLLHNEAVHVRLFDPDPAVMKYWSGTAWDQDASDSPDSFNLTAVDVGDPAFSRYVGDTASGTSWPDGEYLIEYVETSTGSVLKEFLGSATLSASEINAQIVDVLTVDQQPENTQGVPPVNPTIVQMMMYEYMRFRNVHTQTAASQAITNNAGTVIARAPCSEDNTITTKGKFVSGP